MPYLDKYENEDDLEVNVKLILALLRELYLDYYNLENFNRLVENQSFKARNEKVMKEVMINEKQRVYNFHPRIDRQSERLDSQRTVDSLVNQGLGLITSDRSNDPVMTPAFDE